MVLWRFSDYQFGYGLFEPGDGGDAGRGQGVTPRSQVGGRELVEARLLPVKRLVLVAEHRVTRRRVDLGHRAAW